MALSFATTTVTTTSPSPLHSTLSPHWAPFPQRHPPGRMYASISSKSNSSSRTKKSKKKEEPPEAATTAGGGGGGISSEEKQRKFMLERYGFDVDDIISETDNPLPLPKKKGKKERRKVEEEGAAAVATEVEEKKDNKKKEKEKPRETHKLIQVLSGTAKGRKLWSPVGNDVRPMMAVVKGSVFNILQAAGCGPATLTRGRWLDLYCGTGSVGIEALSRGCAEAHFVEMDPWVISNVLQPNLQSTKFLDAAVIHTHRVENFLKNAKNLVGNDVTFDYISVTPPYMEVDYSVLMDQIEKSSLIGENTFVVVEYPLRTELLDTCGPLTKITDRKFGRTILVIYGPEWALKKRK